MRYRLGGAERTYSIGPWPQVGLTDARKDVAKAKADLKSGRDPVVARRVARATKASASARQFKDIAEEWLDKERGGWGEVHYAKSARAIRRDVIPRLGLLPIDEITPSMVASVIESIQTRGVRETAARILQHMNGIFRLAEAKGLRTDNPAAPAFEVLGRPPPVQHRPALLTFPELGDVLRRARRARLSPEVHQCHRLIAYTAVRVENAASARWSDFQLDADVPAWVIPRDQMKIRRGRSHPHRVILPKQILAELRDWKRMQRGEGDGFVFGGQQGRNHVSKDAISKALRVTLQLDGKHVPHGWRSSFSTLARESDQFAANSFEVIKLCLDHIHDSDVARAYDRGERLDARRRLMQWWGDRLDSAERET